MHTVQNNWIIIFSPTHHYLVNDIISHQFIKSIGNEEALAFGDGGNDIEMLQTVGTGVAMGNALDHVKAIADDVCGHVAEDGIYHYCLEKGLI